MDFMITRFLFDGLLARVQVAPPFLMFDSCVLWVFLAASMVFERLSDVPFRAILRLVVPSSSAGEKNRESSVFTSISIEGSYEVL